MGRKLDAILGRKFKSSKLKTVVNLAISRLAILKNHRRSRFAIAHSDLVQLLHLNHHQQALFRAEEVIKDQNMLLVYDMIHEHCDLLKQRINLIEQAINCPEELKEAVSSLLYAAPRCGEFPELQEIRSILTKRFGKEFVDSAIELRSNSRVCQTMIQKLPSKELSLERRMMMLTRIAKENGIALQLETSSPEIIKEKLVYEKIPSQLNTEATILPEKTEKVLSLSESMKKYRDVEHAARDAFESAAYAAAAAKMAVELSRLESFHSDGFDSANSQTTNVFDSSSRYDSESDYEEIIEEDGGERKRYNKEVEETEDLYPNDYSNDDDDMKYKIKKENEGLPSRNAYFSSYKPFPFRHQA